MRAREHDEVEVLGHAFSDPRWNRRTSSDRDWSRMRMQKAGIRDFSRNTASIPPTEIGPSRIFHELRTDGHDQ
jgi:hypothetical protein